MSPQMTPPQMNKGDSGSSDSDNQPGGGSGPSLTNYIISTLLIFLVLVAGYSIVQRLQSDTEEIPISELAQAVQQEQVKKITVAGEDITADFTDGSKKESKKESDAALSQTLKNYGVGTTTLSAVTIDINDPSGFGYWASTLAPFVIPILFILFFVWYLSRQMQGAGMEAFSFGESKARFIDPDDSAQKVTFDDVAGVTQAKNELMEIVEFLKTPEKFLDIGAEVPKGVILMGEPGTGKTLLARAVAGEAGVPFYSISGSEFVEMFVGVGASRVRDLFDEAKKNAPAIIFVDEIDAVGRTRGAGVGGGNDEREQTLNQILVELDGFEPNEKVIVMAATNRPDVLDPALLRPGRFDRRIQLDLPDINDREEILKIHARNKPLEDDIDLRMVAERTPGFSGADIRSLMNEAAIVAARDDRKTITEEDLIQSIEKVMIGPERENHLLSDREKKIAAYHEAGHALVASVLEYADPVHKVSIVSRGKAAGYTLNLPEEEKRFKSRKEFLDQLAMALGGYVTEWMVFDDVTTGPSNDLKKITEQARDMVTKYGMSEKIGPIALEDEDQNPLYGQRLGSGKEYSEEVSADVDEEVERIIKKAQKRAKDAITKHRDLLDAIVDRLLENETIERDAFDALLDEHGVELTKRKQVKKDESQASENENTEENADEASEQTDTGRKMEDGQSD